jgi:hypothetical protein
MMRLLLSLSIVVIPTLLAAQTPAERPPLDFSGLLFGNFQMRTDSSARASTGGKPTSRFDIGRVYLNFRMPAGERGSVRVTTDIFQQSGPAAAYYSGWTVRLKYGYFQYDATKRFLGVDDFTAIARIGMLQNVMIEHVDSYWPRFLGQNELETHGLFASADVGAAALLTLPSRRGEVYLTVMNGSNYSAAENDRFKDFAGRFSWTPFAGDSGFLRTFAITPWYSKGWSGSAFAAGGAGQVAPVAEGLQKDRRGIFAGVRDRRLTVGAAFSQRIEDVESGANTVVSPRAVRNRTSDLVSAFAILRPLELVSPEKRSPFSLFTRYDDFDFDEVTNASNRLTWFGAMWDLNARTTFTLDYQELRPRTGTTTVPAKTWFMHWVTNF